MKFFTRGKGKNRTVHPITSPQTPLVLVRNPSRVDTPVSNDKKMICRECDETLNLKKGTATKYWCSSCDQVVEEPEPKYECGSCGTEFTRSQSADGVGHNCPDCNKWGHVVEEAVCPECEEPVEEIEGYVCKCGAFNPISQLKEEKDEGKEDRWNLVERDKNGHIVWEKDFESTIKVREFLAKRDLSKGHYIDWYPAEAKPIRLQKGTYLLRKNSSLPIYAIVKGYHVDSFTGFKTLLLDVWMMAMSGQGARQETFTTNPKIFEEQWKVVDQEEFRQWFVQRWKEMEKGNQSKQFYYKESRPEWWNYNTQKYGD